jgi:murein DD-endopeptidase MepM/ murein hydrolase activator NlpD
MPPGSRKWSSQALPPFSRSRSIRFRAWLWIAGTVAAAGLFVHSCVRFEAEQSPLSAPVTEAKSLTIPVVGVVTDELVDTFAQARSAGRRHDAIDIIAPRGTSVVAAASGTVEKLFASERGGKTIYIRSFDRRLSYYYAHLDRYRAGLSEDQSIAVGEVIGTVGSTGNAAPSSPHLHFAISRMGPEEKWYQGVPINPYPVLVGNKR